MTMSSLEVFHRRIEDLLDRWLQAMNLVDEEHLAGLEVRQDSHQISRFLNHRPRRRTHSHAELVGNHICERRLAEAWRAIEQDVVECFAPLPRGRDGNLQVFAHAVLADVVIQLARPQTSFVLRVFLDARRCDEVVVSHGQGSGHRRIRATKARGHEERKDALQNCTSCLRALRGYRLLHARASSRNAPRSASSNFNGSLSFNTFSSTLSMAC